MAQCGSQNKELNIWMHYWITVMDTEGAEPGAEKLTQCGCIKNSSSSSGHSRLPPNGSQSYYI